MTARPLACAALRLALRAPACRADANLEIDIEAVKRYVNTYAKTGSYDDLARWSDGDAPNIHKTYCLFRQAVVNQLPVTQEEKEKLPEPMKNQLALSVLT